MLWQHPDEVTLAQLVFFALVLPTFIFHLFTQGPQLRRTWYFFAVFALVKVVGDALLIANSVRQSQGNAPSEGLLTPGSILTSVSLAPLFLGMRLLLSKARRPDTEPVQRLPVIVILIIVGAALSIAGYLQYILRDKYSLGSSLVKISSFVFLVAALVLLFHGVYHIMHTPDIYLEGYKIYSYALLAAMPFILVRIVFFILNAFALSTTGDLVKYSTFSVLNGSWVAKLVMLVLMEMFVAIIYSVAGFIFHRRSRYDYTHEKYSKQISEPRQLL